MSGTPILENLIQFIPQVKGSGFNQLNRGIMSTHRNLFSLRNMFGAFFGYDLYSSIRNAIPAMIDTSRQLGAIHARLFAATGSAKGANQEFSWLLDTTKKLGLELMTTSDRYSLFAAASKQIFSEKETRQIFERVLKLQRVLHMPAEKMSNIYYTMQRMSSEGTLKSRDFLSLQLIPGAFPIAQRAAGFKEGKNGMMAFRKAMRANEIDIKTFLPKFTKELEKQYVTTDKLKEAMNQVDAQLQLAQRYAQGFQMALAKAGFQKDLISTLKVLNIGLSFLETHAHGIYQVLKGIVKLVLLIGIGGTLFSLFNLFKDAKLAFQIMAMAKGLKQMSLAVKEIQLAQAAGEIGGAGGFLGMLIGFLSNPYILGAVLIVGLTVALGFVLKKFFPNVWKVFMAYWILIENKIYQLVDWFSKTALGKWINSQVKIDTSNLSDVKKRQMNGGLWNGRLSIETPSVMPKEPARNYLGGMRLTRQGLEKVPEYGPPIRINKIDASIHIDGTGMDTPEKVAQVVRDATESSYSKIIGSIARSIPNSKSIGLPPFSLSGVLNQ